MYILWLFINCFFIKVKTFVGFLRNVIPLTTMSNETILLVLIDFFPLFQYFFFGFLFFFISLLLLLLLRYSEEV